MRTFSELLKAYIGRTGVSDAELARAVGVQRQTIFRWKEGLVARPRSAEDVLHLSAKLRLTPAERDELLLAAGFPPMSGPAPRNDREEAVASRADTVEIPPAPTEQGIDLPDEVIPPQPAPPPRTRLWMALGLIVLLLAAGIAAMVLAQRPHYPRAAAGETLVVVAQFGNYTGGAQGYNVAGRLSEALQRELDAAGLKDTRAVAWPSAVTDREAAAQALSQSGAGLLIWGEYDSGRVVARLLPRGGLAGASRELSLLAGTPAELPAVINSTLPGDVRYLALYSLAQLYLDGKQPGQAVAALGQAKLNLPNDPGTRAAHYFLWGYANQVSQPPDVDAAIEGYTEALKLDNGLDAAHNNRAMAFLRRRAPGDLVTAVDDLTQHIASHQDDSDAYTNRGSAYFMLEGSANTERAVADFDKAIALAPDDMNGYYNRGLANVRLGEDAKWRADLQRALDGGYAGAREGLCWAYSLSEEPATAIEHCQEILKSTANAGPWENLGVAFARTGQYDAAAGALGKYREKVIAAGGDQPSTEIKQLDEWLSALKAGRNPFDEATLKALREE